MVFQPWKMLLKVAWMRLPVGIIVTIAGFAQAILIKGLACILELFFVHLSQTMLLLKLRLVVETVATLSRCVTMYILIVYQPDLEKGNVFALSFITNCLWSKLVLWILILHSSPSCI